MDSQLIHHFSSHFDGGSNFTMYQLINLLLGLVLWTYLYLYLVYRGYKNKFMQMPIILACGNLVWEFMWGFIFQNQHETGVMISYGAAFLIDLTIFIGILRFMPGHITNKYVAKRIFFLCLLGVTVFSFLWYTFKIQGLDTDAGGNSGNILNALIALAWCANLFTIKNFDLLSLRLGWVKLLADIPIALFTLSVFPDFAFTITICFVSVLLDILYIYLYYSRKNGTGPFHNFDVTGI